MARHKENTNFICANCKKEVYVLTNGSYRNHCPFCLYSLHVDHKPGDRANNCKGLMKAMGLIYKKKKRWQIIHRCLKCNNQSLNKVAIDTIQPDDYYRLSTL